MLYLKIIKKIQVQGIMLRNQRRKKNNEIRQRKFDRSQKKKKKKKTIWFVEKKCHIQIMTKENKCPIWDTIQTRKDTIGLQKNPEAMKRICPTE